MHLKALLTHPKFLIKNFFKGRKAPIIPSLLVHDKLDTRFVEKTNIFNDFFSRQCQTKSNGSTLLSTLSFESTNL